MHERLTRVYKRLDIQAIKGHLMIYGDLSGSCANCNNMDIKLDFNNCPGCGTVFQYISFRNIKNHIPKIQKIFTERPQITVIDFDDYQRNLGAIKAEKFLK